MRPHTLVVTGATGGMGRALLRTIEPTAYRVALVNRDRNRLDAVMADLPKGLQAVAIEADVSLPEGAQAAFAEATEQLGEAPTHLAHCAGTTLLAPLHRTTDAQYRDCLAANLGGFTAVRPMVRLC